MLFLPHLNNNKKQSDKPQPIYLIVIRPVILYGAETWITIERDVEVLKRWEWKVLRSIFGPVS